MHYYHHHRDEKLESIRFPDFPERNPSIASKFSQRLGRLFLEDMKIPIPPASERPKLNSQKLVQLGKLIRTLKIRPENIYNMDDR